MTTLGEPRRRRWAGPGFETFGSIFGFVYTFLAGNALLAVANAPLLFFLAQVADPVAAWPFFLLLSATVAPSLAGIFGSFAALSGEGTAVRPVAAFLRAYKQSFRRTAPLGLATIAVLLFLMLDLALVQSMPAAAAVLVPLVIVVSLLAVCLAVTTVAGAVLLPTIGLRPLAKAALYLCVQRWYLSLAMVLVLAIIAGAALVQPILGVALAPAPLLFLVWSNASYAYGAVLASD